MMPAIPRLAPLTILVLVTVVANACSSGEYTAAGGSPPSDPPADAAAEETPAADAATPCITYPPYAREGEACKDNADCQASPTPCGSADCVAGVCTERSNGVIECAAGRICVKRDCCLPDGGAP